VSERHLPPRPPARALVAVDTTAVEPASRRVIANSHLCTLHFRLYRLSLPVRRAACTALLALTSLRRFPIAILDEITLKLPKETLDQISTALETAVDVLLNEDVVLL